MNRRFALSALAVAVVVFLWLSRGGNRATTPASAPESPASLASGASEELAVATELSSETAIAMDESSGQRDPVPVPQAPERGPKTCEIRGRFVFASGEPAEGVTLRYDWDTYRSAADGTFSIPFTDDDNPNVWAELEGYAHFQWEWFGQEPDGVIDLGDVVVERGGMLRVRIVDRVGRTLTEGWTVAAQVEPRFYPDGRDEDSRVFAELAGGDGTFLLEHVRSGRVRLEADSDVAGSLDGQTVLVRDGEVADVEIRYTGPDTARRITVSLDLERFWWFDFTPEIRLSGPGMEPRLAQAIEDHGDTFSFDDLPAGSYVIEIDDPRLLPWRADGVEPGTALTAEVKGSASLELRIFDKETGAELDDYGALLRVRDAHFSPADFDLFEDEGGSHAGCVVDGILPGDFTLIVSAPGLAPAEVEIEDLAPCERRQIVARLGRGGGIAGTLVRADGSPVPRAEVTLLAADEARMGYGYEEGWPRAETDAQGRFAFGNLASGRYEVRVAPWSLLEVAKTVEIFGETTTEIRLTLPPESFASGRVLGPKGVSFEDMSIVLVGDFEDGSEGELAAELDSDGSFRIGPVRPASYAVLLQLPEEVQLDTTKLFLRAHREIGRVELKAGENPDRALDARPVWPGTLVVRARGDASALSGAVISVEGREGGDSWAGIAGLDQDGEVELTPLFAGRYGILLVAGDESWVVAAPELTTLAARGSAVCDLDVTLVPGELRIVERDTQEPFANQSLFLVPKDPIQDAFGVSFTFETDHEGALRATLTPGTYAITLLLGRGVAFAGPDGKPPPTVHWTSAGPDPDEVSVQRLEADEDDSEDR
jgi:hypothetical protein